MGKNESVTPDRLLRLDQIIPHILPISKTSWWNGVKSGIYPPPVKIGERSRAWRESQIMRVVTNGIDRKQ
jgi:prophage regulatory protein